jgi:cytochrome c
MKALLIAGALAAGLTVGVVQAQSDLLKTKGCLGCHDLDKKKVGPAFKDVAAKYKGDKSKAPEIVAKMKEGKGHPKLSASDADLKSAVEQALSTK